MGSEEKTDWTYRDAVRYISGVPKFTQADARGGMKELAARLGRPEEGFHVIHVAGTNGKGSVCAFLEAMLRSGGYRTGLFTSPHLVTMNERFQVNRRNVSDEAFAAAFTKVRKTVDGMIADGFDHPSFFEFLFAMGLVIFRDAGIDVLVMETGLGGRLDATNVVEKPDVCVITSISLDHTEYLGDTAALIAGEKAGIIKKGVPVVYDASCAEAAAVIAQRAAELDAPASPFEPAMARITRRGDDGIDLILDNRQFSRLRVHVPFIADYQVNNAALALMALRLFDPEKRIPDGAAAAALAGARWSGRMEQIMPGVVLDGAHNADGIRQFVKTVQEVQRHRPVSLLFSAVAEKDYESMIRSLAGGTAFTSVVVTKVGGARQVDPAVFARIFRSCSEVPVEVVEDPAQAFDRALQLRPAGGVLFCAGSLYLAGEILKNHGAAG